MTYAIYYSNGSLLTSIDDQTFDTTSTSLTLAGRGAVNYGAPFGQNLVYLMENFANATAPAQAMIGQLWFDTANNLMKVYSNGNKWVAFANVGGLGNTVGIPQGTTLGGIVSSGVRVAGATGFNAQNTTTLNSTTVGLTLSEGKIISVASAETIPLSALPAYITLQGVQLAFSTRFPNGIRAGVTLATDSAVGYVNAGLATSSLYADVAERYEIDVPGEPGDVVSLGGEKEIFLTSTSEDLDVFGVISTSPAVRMNDEVGSDLTHPLVALLGRVPCKVVGPVRKGQRLVSAGLPGVAKAAEGVVDARAIIGRAIGEKTTLGVEMVEIVIGRA